TGTSNKIAVVNDNKTITVRLKSTENTQYEYVSKPIEDMQKSVKTSGYDYILYIPEFPLDKPEGIQLLGEKQAGLSLSGKVSDHIEEMIRNQTLKDSGLKQTDLYNLKASVDISINKINETLSDEDSSA